MTYSVEKIHFNLPTKIFYRFVHLYLLIF
jgi:hypothetical protein